MSKRLRTRKEDPEKVSQAPSASTDPEIGTAVAGDTSRAVAATTKDSEVRRGRKPSERGKDVVSLPFDAQDPLTSVPPSQHHQISECNRYWLDVTSWLAQNESDRAVQVGTQSSQCCYN